MTDPLPVRRALLSTYAKHGLGELARGLADLGVELVSTGSTAAAIREAGVAVTEVADITGFPEVLDGRVKTLHPVIHAGVLADRDKPAHLEQLSDHGIAPIDLVVANLYPFADTVADPLVGEAQAIEMIDVGGPTMVRAAAKNHRHVGVVVSPDDYRPLLGHLRDDGGLPESFRRDLARKAFVHTATYDAAVVAWLDREEPFPEVHQTGYVKAADLRYGENPHQRAAYYVGAGAWGVGSARQRHGKDLSYNNLLDTDAAWLAAADFAAPCVAIIKHTNPAGLAIAPTLAEAYPKALSGDPVSAFGGIVAANRAVDIETAEQIVEVFTEVVVAPGFTEEALALLAQRAGVRILEIVRPHPPPAPQTVRSMSGGLLVQDLDGETPLEVDAEGATAWTTPSATAPDAETLADLRFAWRVAKHVKSNAIVLADQGAVVGIGAGQMSRVDSVRLAVEKAGPRADGAVLASDAFFPFRDGPEVALAAGVRAIVQPGGSKRDDEVVEACDEHGVPLSFTGRRHFRH